MSASLRVVDVRHGILNGVSLAADGPGLVALTGRSGSGKSTLCHLVAGLERPEYGEVLVDGVPPADITDWGRISVLPQRLGLLGALTAAENLALPAQVRGADVDDRAHLTLLEALSVQMLWARPVAEGSIGEQQRVAVARALALRSPLVVLDEPTAHQDDGNAERVIAAVAAALEDDTLIVVSTHDPRLLALTTARFALDGAPVAGWSSSDHTNGDRKL